MRIDGRGVLINYHDDPDVTRLVIPPSVKKIAPHAFYGTEYLEEVIISDGVEEIGQNAFEGAHELKRVEMADSVKRFGMNAFKECRKLSEVKLSAGLRYIPPRAFSECLALTSAEVPDGVEAVGDYAFNSCIALDSVRLPQTLTSIGSGAFMDTFMLKSITIPDAIDEIDPFTFCRSGIERVHWRGYDLFLDKSDEQDGIWSFEFYFYENFVEGLKYGELRLYGVSKELRKAFAIAQLNRRLCREAWEYVRKHFPDVFRSIIRTNNIHAAEAVMKADGLLSNRNIARYIKFAQENERQEMYVMLLKHKDSLGGYKNSGKGRFSL